MRLEKWAGKYLNGRAVFSTSQNEEKINNRAEVTFKHNI